MTDVHRSKPPHIPTPRADLDDLVRAKGLMPLRSIGDLAAFAADIWDSDADLDDFLADVRTSRDADVA